MSRFSAPSQGDRHGRGHGTPVGVRHQLRNVVDVPALKPGQHRCPVCRAGATLTTRGSLRAHNDLFGDRCWNKATGEATGITAPPVVVPAGNTSPLPRPPSEASRLDVGSSCRDCGKWLPGERSLCGRCYAIGGRT